MLTPIDIQTKEFSKSFKGYKDVEVDGFLDEITADYEKLFRENVELKDKLGMLTEQVKHYSSIEQTIQKTLIMAQTTAEEVTLNARKKSESILEDAEKEHKRKTENGNEELRKIKEEYDRVRKEMMLYKARCKSIISSQLSMIESELEEFSFEGNKAEELVVEEIMAEEPLAEIAEVESSESIEKTEALLEADLGKSKAVEENVGVDSTRRIDLSEIVEGV